MQLQLIQIDAFSSEVFSGNPAAVVPLEQWLPDETMQKIAIENNLSETAFYIPAGNGFHIRWFTPASEVRLCGHATLATAHYIFRHCGFAKDVIEFQSQSGPLKVYRRERLLVLDFPASELNECEIPETIPEAFGSVPLACWKGRDDMMLVFESEAEIRNLTPNFEEIKKLDARGIICTAESDSVDFVSRFFAPNEGINEDPVTGSAHTMLIPFWSKKLGRNQLKAKQLSARGGFLHCENKGNRVEIGGEAVTYLTGTIFT